MASKDEEVKVKREEEGDIAVTLENETEDHGTTEEPATPAEADAGEAAAAVDEEDDSDKKRRVYVGNLAWEVSWQDLKDLMKTLNHEVIRVDIMQTSDGRSKGCGIVEFATPEGAAEAVLTLNDTELSGRRIFVREDRENASSSGPGGRDYASRGGGGRYNNAQRGNRYHGGNNHSGSGSGGYNNHIGGGGGSGNHPTVSSDPESQSRRVYVGNMSWDVTWSDLKDHMKSAGEVVRADVICEHNGRSKGCGIVEFETEEGAQKAIETLTHTELRGRMIFVREDREGSGSEGKGGHAPRRIGAYGSNPNQTSNNNSVYVWNLSYDVSWQDLKDHMRKAGNVDQATILTGSDGSTSIGCGIVVYQSARDAARAIRELQESDLKGRPVRLREDKIASAGSRSDRGARGGRGGSRGGGRLGGGKIHAEEASSSEVTQLYVGNLSYDTTWKELKEHFKQAGDVVRADVKTSDNGRSKGFGIVKFARAEDAQTAISTLSGVELDGRPLEVRPDHKA
mmetsp:Transcript_21290/g.50345  ORF Transcript_21290/g.50345 Transcript_21290/m.50345 type:complete len:510 (+) Transcript_21290:864-2393(+)|eukprot:CAMPEP_0172410696 /NCGR_PEP_ID=MMETSP1061-20121228/77016_1 /TAXON_ID=37318 /ORGANISM="Pseudo-nitzschia pungens, Strain cf. pungens" /LENGTH=509 /DNA_ID=CAMNT_0013146889 /DNA_START=1993 /DNA_END=3522 /DNA_ORIENTATION=-